MLYQYCTSVYKRQIRLCLIPAAVSFESRDGIARARTLTLSLRLICLRNPFVSARRRLSRRPFFLIPKLEDHRTLNKSQSLDVPLYELSLSCSLPAPDRFPRRTKATKFVFQSASCCFPVTALALALSRVGCLKSPTAMPTPNFQVRSTRHADFVLPSSRTPSKKPVSIHLSKAMPQQLGHPETTILTTAVGGTPCSSRTLLSR